MLPRDGASADFAVGTARGVSTGAGVAVDAVLAATAIGFGAELTFFDLAFLAGFLADFVAAFFVAGPFVAFFAVFFAFFTPRVLFFAAAFLMARTRGDLRTFLVFFFEAFFATTNSFMTLNLDCRDRRQAARLSG